MNFCFDGGWRRLPSIAKLFFSQQTVAKKATSQKELCYQFAMKAKRLADKNRPDLAYGLISKALASSSLKEPNTKLFNTLISGCATAGALTLACDAYKMMQSRSVEPDTLTYLSLMNAYAIAGNTVKKAIMEPLSEAKRSHYMTRMLALFEEAQSRNLLSTSIFNVLLKGISWLGTLDHLAMVFPLSANDPLPTVPDHISYTTAILCVAYCGGNFSLAERYFERMKQVVFNGNATVIPKESILAMLTAYKLAIVEEPRAKGRIFRKARDFALLYGKYMNDAKVLDSFLNICKFAKEYKYGLQMFERITATRTTPIDDSLEKTHLSLLIFCQQYDKAIQLFRLIKRPSRLAINAMLEGCRLESKLDDCMQIFQLFEHTPNLVPNIHSCEHAIMCIIGAHYPKFNAKDPMIEKRIEFLQRIIKIVLEKEKKLFTFFAHAALDTKLQHFCEHSQNPELLQVYQQSGLAQIPRESSRADCTLSQSASQ